jgi:hypothetical protein
MPKSQNAILRKLTSLQHGNARVVPIPKSGKNTTLPPFYKPVSILDTVGRFFEMILITRFLREIKERRLLCDEQFRFRTGHSTTLQLVRLLERVNRNFTTRG